MLREKEFTCSSQKDRPGQACVFAARILLKIWSWKFIIQPHRHWRPIWAVTSGLIAANVVPCRHFHPSVFHASWKSILPVPPHDSVSTAFPCFQNERVISMLVIAVRQLYQTHLTKFCSVFRGWCIAKSISITRSTHAGAAARTPGAPRTPTGRVVFCVNN